MKMKLLLVFCLCLTICLPFAAADPFDQSDVPVEVDTSDPNMAKIILISGQPSHNTGQHETFADCAVLRNLLLQTPGVFPVIVREWPQNPAILAHARAIVFLADGVHEAGQYPPDRLKQLKAACDAGAGLCAIHYALHHPRAEGEQMLPYLGGYYDWDTSAKGHWTADFKPIEHPICRGVQPVQWEDGWHFNIRFVDGLQGVTPLLVSAAPDKLRTTADAKKTLGREEILSWAYEAPKGQRAFTFSGMHLHKDWEEANRRRFIVNGILWSARIDPPTHGAPVELNPADLQKWLDKKAPPKAKAPKTAATK
jgi:hypothetical protein